MFQTNSDLRASDLFRISRFGIRISRRRRAFTLIEMLVVIGIVVLLVALLVPAGAIAISTARDASMSLEISQLAQEIETYKNKMGDYPPSMGEVDRFDADGDGNTTESLYLSAPYTSVVERHLRKCYPKMTTAEKSLFYTYLAPYMSQSEALWFWLSQTQNDERQPFFSPAGNYKRFYDFKEDRIVPTKIVTIVINGNNVPFQLNYYKPAYAKETAFMYLDSRTYIVHGDILRGAPFVPPGSPQGFQENGPVQPYFDDKINTSNGPFAMNLNTFQIVCAGQDGEFGAPVDILDNNWSVLPNYPMKRFVSGVNYTDEDDDNLTNFSEGKRLGNHIP